MSRILSWSTVRALSIALVFASLVPARPSAAQSSDASPPPATEGTRRLTLHETGAYDRPAERRHWYGAQSLIVDAIALAALVAAGAMASACAQASWSTGGSCDQIGAGVLLSSLAIYALGPPIVHVVHGRAGAAFASLGMRLAVPAVFAAIAYDPHSGLSGFGTLGAAIFAGWLFAVVLDDLLLANEAVPQPAKFAVFPAIDSSRHAASLQLLRRF